MKKNKKKRRCACGCGGWTKSTYMGGHWCKNNPEHTAKMIKRNKSEKQIDLVKESWEDEEVREARIEGNTEAWKRNYTKRVAALHKSVEERFSDPVYAKKYAKRISDRWKDPVYKEIVAAGVSAGMKAGGAAKGAATMHEQFLSGRRKPGGVVATRFHRGWINTKKGGRLHYDCGWELAFIQLLEDSKLIKRFVREPFPIPGNVGSNFSATSLRTSILCPSDPCGGLLLGSSHTKSIPWNLSLFGWSATLLASANEMTEPAYMARILRAISQAR